MVNPYVTVHITDISVNHFEIIMTLKIFSPAIRGRQPILPIIFQGSFTSCSEGVTMKVGKFLEKFESDAMEGRWRLKVI